MSNKAGATARTAPATDSGGPAALGFRAHAGWASMVCVAGPARAPRIVGRWHIDLAGSTTPRTVQPYHAARKRPLSDAAGVVQRATDLARQLARDAIRRAVGELGSQGWTIVGCGLGIGSTRPASTLAVTLASHALVHAAEGLLFRDALAAGAVDCGLPVTAVPERDLHLRAATTFAISPSSLRKRLTELGQPIGAPWRDDEKLATLAAWLALVAERRSAPPNAEVGQAT